MSPLNKTYTNVEEFYLFVSIIYLQIPTFRNVLKRNVAINYEHPTL